MTAQGPKLMGSKASRHELDGAMRVIPGYEGVSTDRAEQYTGDEMPILVPSAAVTTSTIQSNKGEFLVPFKAKLISAHLVVTVSGIVTDAITLNVGSASDHGQFISGFSFPAAKNLTGITVPMATGAVKSRSIVAGTVLQVEYEGTTDAQTVVAQLIIAPQL